MENRAHKQTLLDAYRTPGFRVRARVDSYALEPPAFVITLERRQKNRLRRLRKNLRQLLRQQVAAGARSWLRRP
jgi:hypothetical protein